MHVAWKRPIAVFYSVQYALDRNLLRAIIREKTTIKKNVRAAYPPMRGPQS